MDENNRIVIKRISRDKQSGAPEEEVHVFRTSGSGSGVRWLVYLLFVPVFIIMVVLGIFFFTAFLALFAVVAVGLGLRLWWLRRKLRKSAEAAQGEQGEYVVIEDAEIVEESTHRRTRPTERTESSEPTEPTEPTDKSSHDRQ